MTTPYYYRTVSSSSTSIAPATESLVHSGGQVRQSTSSFEGRSVSLLSIPGSSGSTPLSKPPVSVTPPETKSSSSSSSSPLSTRVTAFSHSRQDPEVNKNTTALQRQLRIAPDSAYSHLATIPLPPSRKEDLVLTEKVKYVLDSLKKANPKETHSIWHGYYNFYEYYEGDKGNINLIFSLEQAQEMAETEKLPTLPGPDLYKCVGVTKEDLDAFIAPYMHSYITGKKAAENLLSKYKTGSWILRRSESSGQPTITVKGANYYGHFIIPAGLRRIVTQQIDLRIGGIPSTSSSSSSSTSTTTQVPAPLTLHALYMDRPTSQETIMTKSTSFVTTLLENQQVLIVDIGNSDMSGFEAQSNQNLYYLYYGVKKGKGSTYKENFYHYLNEHILPVTGNKDASPWRVMRSDPTKLLSSITDEDRMGYVIVWSTTYKNIVIGELSLSKGFRAKYYWKADEEGKPLSVESAQTLLKPHMVDYKGSDNLSSLWSRYQPPTIPKEFLNLIKADDVAPKGPCGGLGGCVVC